MEPICPECRDGKHRNCDGDAWDVQADELANCECYMSDHQPPTA